MKYLHLLAILGVALSAGTALAVDGSSGCGPGWYIAKDNSFISTSTRNTTHGYLSPVVWGGMTSGTSNCAKHTILENKRATEHFIAVNSDILRQEAAQGRGEYVEALAATFGCEGKVTQHFGKVLRENFQVLFGEQLEPLETTQRVFQVIQRDKMLSPSCSLSPSLS